MPRAEDKNSQNRESSIKVLLNREFSALKSEEFNDQQESADFYPLDEISHLQREEIKLRLQNQTVTPVNRS